MSGFILTIITQQQSFCRWLFRKLPFTCTVNVTVVTQSNGQLLWPKKTGPRHTVAIETVSTYIYIYSKYYLTVATVQCTRRPKSISCQIRGDLDSQTNHLFLTTVETQVHEDEAVSDDQTETLFTICFIKTTLKNHG